MNDNKTIKPDNDFTYLFNTGENYYAYRGLGAHPEDGGIRFSVWAPDVEVRVSGDFNDWKDDDDKYLLESIGDTGIHTGVIPEASLGSMYKYDIRTPGGKSLMKADPFAFMSEGRPGTASIVCDPVYSWNDKEWMEKRGDKDGN